MRPRLLDLFCGAGGAALGYYRAGFDVVGVDSAPQKNYPYDFYRADALQYCQDHGRDFAVIHASPPCQKYSHARYFRKEVRDYPDLIGPTRAALLRARRPYIIENVPGAPLIRNLFLCGSMFNQVWHRHRWFESPVMLFGLSHALHKSRGRYTPGKVAIGFMDSDCQLMGVDWMTRMERRQAVPPVYTEFIGQQLIAALRAG